MFFPKKSAKFQYDDIRVVKKFAFFPTKVLTEDDMSEGTVWLESYDCILKFYCRSWYSEMRVRRGSGMQAAQRLVRKYGWRLIDEG